MCNKRIKLVLTENELSLIGVALLEKGYSIEKVIDSDDNTLGGMLDKHIRTHDLTESLLDVEDMERYVNAHLLIMRKEDDD